LPTSLAFFVGLGTVFMLAVLLIELKFMLLPLVLAFFVCCLLNPLVEAFCRRRLPRSLAVVLTLALGFGVLWLAFSYAMMSMTALADGFPWYRDKIGVFMGSVVSSLGDRLSFVTPEFLTAQISNLSLGGLISGFFSSFLSLTGYVALTAILILYFLPALSAFPGKLRKAFPGARGERLAQAVSQISSQVQRYVLYKTLLCAAQGILVSGFCFLFRVDFAGSWGVLTFLSGFVPKIGAPFSVLPAALVCLVQHGWARSLWLCLTLLVICFVHGNLVEPRFLGKSVDLSPAATFLSILAWGWVWGAIGMILAVPLMALVKFSCDNFPSLRPAGALMGN
jgi:predicted PurR-regulated permease PerM